MTRTHAPGRRFRAAGSSVLAVVALIGASLSWGSLYQAAGNALGGPVVTVGAVALVLSGTVFSIMLDGFILACSLLYVSGVRAQRPSGGWRTWAHIGIGFTIAANLGAATSIQNAPWHAFAPILWSASIELVARDILGELRAVHTNLGADRIPLRLWVTGPLVSARAAWWMGKTGQPSAAVARVEADHCAGAAVALGRAMPGVRYRATRRDIARRMWAGTISADDVYDACGWTADGVSDRAPETILRLALLAGQAGRLSRIEPVPASGGDHRVAETAVSEVAAGDLGDGPAPVVTRAEPAEAPSADDGHRARPQKVDRAKVRALSQGGRSNAEVARELGCSPKTVGRILAGQGGSGRLSVVGG